MIEKIPFFMVLADFYIYYIIQFGNKIRHMQFLSIFLQFFSIDTGA